MGGDPLVGGAVHKVRAVAQFSVLQKVLLYSRCAPSLPNIRGSLCAMVIRDVYTTFYLLIE